MSNLCRQKEENLLVSVWPLDMCGGEVYLHHDSLNLQFNIAVVDSMYKKASM